MEIIVLHGDDSSKSYNRLMTLIDSARSLSYTIERISDSSKNFFEAVASEGLFKSKRLILIDNVNLIGKRESDFLKKIKNSPDLKLVIYHPQTLSPSFLKMLPSQKRIEEFKIPKLIWSFLYSFYPGNSKICLKLFHDLIKNHPTEVVFSLLSKHLKDVYWAKVEAEGLLYPKWRVEKLKNQALLFTFQKLSRIINELAKIDIKYKTSNGNLTDFLDFLIVTELE